MLTWKLMNKKLGVMVCCLLSFSVLSEDGTQSQTFEQLATSLHHYFNNKTEYFKIGMALVGISYAFD